MTSVGPNRHSWKEDRDTAEEFGHQRCNTVLKLHNDPQEVLLTLFSRSCDDNELVEDIDRFISYYSLTEHERMEYDKPDEVYSLEGTPIWIHHMGMISIGFSAVFLISYFRDVASHMAPLL